MSQIPWLDDELWFPPLDQALADPDGLLAAGGDLSPQRLLLAYRHGIFPWFDDQQPILWWSPDPRCVLYPDQLYLSRSLKKLRRQQRFEVSFDRAFDQVIAACAAPRMDDPGTWITTEMEQAYAELHHLGIAHSVEVWQQGELVGGLYGVAIGRVFFGESMFSRVSNASKVGFATLVEQLSVWGYALIDCQVETEHLMSLGACLIPRSEFARQLEQHCAAENHWRNN
ncbi:leucyl/phenylalanyl-tRNA--protein transferase [Motiliproteus coralliicola]|uniref:Leucyl/phenylalanyl-tRNA--protein transferase n=1 Tax=Motiliproteus coralliicola TaxID=2283196 RepID=A0A369WSS8_9GAMM|nr:leucyl/phenylalanyl-tRNA--protein transferase [Motiliproteus coralliicola]RDE24742.1 leucyl/phenylalanyl-tRNA--protein transferase [Motiliproteus coralliicola]